MTFEAGRFTRALVGGAVACVLSLPACADFSRGAPSAPSVPGGDGGSGSDASGDATPPDGSAVSSFAIDVYPLLVSGCATCHSTGNEAGDTQLVFAGSAAADYAAVVMFVDTSAPSASRLLSKASGNGHQGGTVYAAGSPELDTISQWIQQGAQP